MKKMVKKLICLTLVLALSMGSLTSVMAIDNDKIAKAIEDMSDYMYKTVQKPVIGSTGGEWAIIGLARNKSAIPQAYYDEYYTGLTDFVVKEKGILHKKKYTEYSRVILALTAIGKDPKDVGGYNLLTPLGDYEKTIWQGLNGPIWALIALDSNNYEMPINTEAKVQATREMYIDRILDCQLLDGGFSLTGTKENNTGKSDPDITGMALTALAKYKERTDVQNAIDKALAAMSLAQGADGEFQSYGTDNLESTVQMIVALTSLGISIDDARFIKEGNSMLDILFKYYTEGSGFAHTKGSASNQMASEQGLYALVAVNRTINGESNLYYMTDIVKKKPIISQDEDEPVKKTTVPVKVETGKGLVGKNINVIPQVVVNNGKTFADITKHKNKIAIEELCSRNIINGKTETSFDPEGEMTRAEFATIVVKALGLIAKENDVFTDIQKNIWYAPFVGVAYDFGIIKGSTPTTFSPNGNVSRQEAAIMVSRAAALCGMNINITGDSEIMDTLASFGDYRTSNVWAREALTFCYKENILAQADINIEPLRAIKRGEVANMLFNLLTKAKLI